MLSPPRSYSLTVPLLPTQVLLNPIVASIPSPSAAHRRLASAGSLLVVCLPLTLRHPYLIQLRLYFYPYLYSPSARRPSLHVDAALATRASPGQRCAPNVAPHTSISHLPFPIASASVSTFVSPPPSLMTSQHRTHPKPPSLGSPPSTVPPCCDLTVWSFGCQVQHPAPPAPARNARSLVCDEPSSAFGVGGFVSA